jgi:hypothetical protein
VREFAKGSFTLDTAPRPLRLIYAAFLLLASLGFASQLGVQLGRIGITPTQIAAYYRGSESGEVLTFAKPFGQLLEVFHAHAFMMAVIYLILAHLFAATSSPPRFKAAVLTVTFAGMLGDLLAPWLVRYGAAGWAWLALAAWCAEGLGALVLVAVSGWECCRPRA